MLLTLPTCLEDATSLWTSLSWTLFGWLVRPGVVLPVLLMLIVGPRVLRWWPCRRGWSRLGVVLLVSYLIGLSPVATAVGDWFLVRPLPPDRGQPADAIVVLGRGGPLRMSRVKTAVELWQTQRAPLIVASGRGDAWPIKNDLVQAQVPGRQVLVEPCSRTTYENAQETASLLLPQGQRRIILVTDPPHLLRSHLTFQKLGFQVIPHPSPLPRQLDWPRRHLLTMREWISWLSYGVQGRYGRNLSPSSQPISHQIQQGHADSHPTGHLLRNQAELRIIHHL